MAINQLIMNISTCDKTKAKDQTKKNKLHFRLPF